MAIDVLEATISKVLRSGLVQDEVEFVWHAGEPLIVGIAFYERALALIRKHNTRCISVKHSIQTNGISLNNEWCRFFSDNQFCVGISIDGPECIHDGQRMGWSRRGSRRWTMRGYTLLRSHAILPSVICVLTHTSLQHPDEILEFFLQIGCGFLCFNLEEVEHANVASSFTRAGEPRSVLVAEYRRFMSRVYELWRPHAPVMIIGEFRDIARTFLELRQDHRYFCRPLETIGFGIVTIQQDGNISTFSPEFAGAVSTKYGNFVVGNILNGELDSMQSHPTYLQMNQDVEEGVRHCRETCGWFPVCGGGFTSNKYAENRSLLSTETTTCLLHRQTLASVMFEKLADASVHL